MDFRPSINFYPENIPSATLILFAMILTAAILLMAIPKTWKEAVRQNEDGSYSLSREWEEAIDQKKEKIEQHELYMLVAKKNGMYLCKRCPTGKFYLYEGELYRYGTTGNGKKRRGYSDKWEAGNNLRFFHISYGDEATVKLGQTKLIGTYAIHPENMNRPVIGTPGAKNYWHRLVIPPGNGNLN